MGCKITKYEVEHVPIPFNVKPESPQEQSPPATSVLSADYSKEKHILVLVRSRCCPWCASLKSALVWQDVDHVEVLCDMGCTEPWLTRVSPDKTTPVLALFPRSEGTDVNREKLLRIKGLTDGPGSTSTIALMKWVDGLRKTGPSGPSLFPQENPSFAEAMRVATEQLAPAIAKVAMASALPMQKEWRPKAVAAVKALVALLKDTTEEEKYIAKTKTPTAADAVILAFLHRFPILVRFRSWTPETKQGQVSEFSVPSVDESAFPDFAKYRLMLLSKAAGYLESEADLLAWAEKRVPQPPPLNMGRIEHESMRYWMAQAKMLASKRTPEDRNRLALVWDYLFQFVEAHSIGEDQRVYPALEKMKPGCTAFSQEEHKEELPKLAKSVKDLATWAASPQEEHNEDLDAGVQKDIMAYCESLEQHLQHEEEKLFPVMSTMTPEDHKKEFPSLYHSSDSARPKLFGFILQGLNLSQQITLIRICIDSAPLDQKGASELKAFLGNEHGSKFMTSERVDKITGLVREFRQV